MADGKGPGRWTPGGILFGVSMLILVLVSIWFFMIQTSWWFPEVASEKGVDIDRVFYAVLIVTGIAFVVVQAMLGYFAARYGENGNEKAEFWHDNPRAEAFLLIVTAVTLTVLVFMGQRVWASVYFTDPPADAMVVEVTGEQFQWNFHYPGTDGAFGRRDVKLITNTNFVGLDRNDPPAKDDVITLNQMHVVANRAVKVRLNSKDVIHSFFLPNMRVKQDAVPGMNIEIWFMPTKSGAYEIACAELCGLGHYRMKAFLTVDPDQQTFDKWLAEQAAQQ